jgi:DNA-binding NarL/FixJ family response regulator
MRVFLADDHPLFRMGLRIALEQEQDIQLIGEASDGFATVEKIRSSHPDICLIDVDMPGISGIRVVRILRQEMTAMKILILSSYDDENYVQDAMRAGADGYVLKFVDVPELVRIIRAVCTDRAIVSPYLVNLALDPGSQDEDAVRTADENRLTAREREILEAIIEGLSNKEISNQLFISPETVKSHTKKIYQKLNVKNRVEAALAGAKLSTSE